MFRLPSHLEDFIPPPRFQVPQTRPWRGKLVWHTQNPSEPIIEIHCTAAETEGDNQVELWPAQFNIHIMTQRPMLDDVRTHLKRGPSPPMCMFMPDRHPNQAEHARNLSNFERLTRTLLENQFIAIAPWNNPAGGLTGAGIVLFPTGTSRSLLVGAIYLYTNFPEFLAASLPPRPSSGPSLIPRHLPYGHFTPGNSPYDPAPPNIASSQRQSSSG